MEWAQLFPVLTTSPVSFEQFMEVSSRFPDFRMEHEKNGQITIMPPTFFGSGQRESEANGFVWQWNHQTKLGKTISPSTGIKLRDGSTKQADAAWISNEKLAAADAAKLDESFLFLEPDFVIELRSKTDDLENLKSKMADSWIANGVRLAWLIDPYEEKAWVYRANGSIDVLEGFSGKKLSGENVLPGFELNLEEFKLPKGD
jgi:Uma2 family endonuclease